MSTEVTVDGSSGIRPNRFGGKGNFSAWKFKTLAYLQSLGLKEVVVLNRTKTGVEVSLQGAGPSAAVTSASMKKGKGVILPDTSSSGIIGDPFITEKSAVSGSDVFQIAIRRSEKAYAILLNLLEDDLIDLVAHVEPGDAHGVWTVLLDTYEAKSTASLCYKLDQLMNIQFRSEKESFDVFKARFTRLVAEVKEMGETISPAIQRYVLLKSLPQAYEALVQSLKINDNISMDEVYTHIKDYVETEKRRRAKVSGTVAAQENVYGGEKAYALCEREKKDKARKLRDKRRDQSKKECFQCGVVGHERRDCPINSQLSCTKCLGTGHVSRFCPSSDSENDSDGSGRQHYA
jgi:hypothetical protein